MGTLRGLEDELQQEYTANRRLLSFDEYFAAFCESPNLLARSAAQYVCECIEHYGRAEVGRPEGLRTRYRIFDCEWDGGRDRLVGLEAVQGEVYRALRNFIRDRRVTRLVLLHGPNGSAKSSLIKCLQRGLEHYSTTDEGAIYTFNWVFPSTKISKKRVGFASDDGERPSLASYAKLEDEDVDARLPGDLRDHPILLLPPQRRRQILDELRGSGALDEDFALSEYLTDGDLSPRSRLVYDALLNAYHGDVQRVLQHVQVQRFYFSRRYRVGVVTIEPQMHVDASMRQVTADQNLQALPPALRSLSLFEPTGDLVDANRGLIEFNDLLKKPLDAYKYLLATCEKGTVTLPNAILHLDTVFLASSNETLLSAFKEYADFPSFKGRMDLIRMPYICDYEVEQTIYDDHIAASAGSAPIVPHASEVLALWAVLTRLRRPRATRVPESIRSVVEELDPLAKADLYAGRGEPPGLSPEQARELRASVRLMKQEASEGDGYEGSFGASPRLMKQLMLNALQTERHYGLNPLAIFDELREIIKHVSVYEWLKLEEDSGYHDAAGFIDTVFDRYLGWVNDEVHASMGLVSEEQYLELFSRYILHVSYTLKGERIDNPATGRSEPPDVQLMAQLETIWKVTEPESFRRDLVSRIGAWRIDSPDEEIDYRRIFANLIAALEHDYYERQKSAVRKMSEHVLRVLSAEEGDGSAEGLDAGDRRKAEQTIENLVERYGYPRRAIRGCLDALLKHRY